MSSSTHTHPRRRPFKATNPSTLNTHSMTLRKSGTFSSPTSVQSELCGLENHPYMPKRSPTSTENLEDLLHNAAVRRVTNLLADFDKKLAGHPSDANILNDPEVLPLPSFMLDHTTLDEDPMDIEPKSSPVERSPHQHASDSGLGSSISGSKYGDAATTRESVSTSITSTHSAVTGSFTALDSQEGKHTLGEYACKQIHDSIIKPILAEKSLEDFHPLIKDVPRRIGNKDINNLRDLEKTLIFLAPDFSTTPTKYLEFCERSIQLLHATVDQLSEQDQRLPADRPYTNRYFLDLVEQIRRYAAIMAATRQKEENGEDLDEMDYHPGEKITLRGGLSHNGRPVELVREKEDGKVIPLVEGSPSDEEYATFSSAKRALSLSDDEVDDDGVRRSMARRRKSEKPGDVMHMCRDCKKDFKRPCDLTKHEKTHSRPWKCTEEKCKYYDLGWPTEKERDRHVNDKHSAAPPQYKCLYPPCTYASKRESNCKQHMEKAHGWEYVRSKSNGRKKTTGGSERSPPTPLTPFMGTPMSSLATPMTPFQQSPFEPMQNDFGGFNNFGFGTPALSHHSYQDEYRRNSTTTDGSAMTYSSGQSPTEPNAFDNAVTPEEATINHNDIFGTALNALNTNFSTGFQQPTPALSTGFDDFEFARPFPVNTNTSVPHLSPNAQADVTLFSPHLNNMQIDEGFEDGLGAFGRPTGDFPLFDDAPNTAPTTGEWFPDLNQFGGQFDTTFDDIMGNAWNNH
ncbi:uncharacterized protein BDZ99DRAFT_83997 [Mytilinidion resinicola]|uniref:C2H2-type domain-containing protein n=1 Tax=Mytilinidion resinicola TaxID=574789 RepID=A0A6A6YD00_9PEZI|nr:uncharacterized protein BDZ99DRAFT_83997 [Mytilinidion resinicola]KAF2806706.1 hypothetical protein BDZ99DRAFT_83997 [Mytilinidion resinicola]